ncbi:MAG TPA: glycosyl hydrolase family 18 protein [bacterium]|nr:glycosyl hydrolase family 18 protein [bacterium]
MKSEVRIVAVIFSLVIILAIIGSFLKNIGKQEKLLYPFSKNSDIFSFLTPHKKPKYRVYGYLPYWSLDSAKYLQYDKLTDIAYFGLYINSDGTFKEKVLDDEGYEILEPGYKNWKENKTVDEIISNAKKNGVRVALTVIAHDDEDNDTFLNCRECWSVLMENVKKELKNKGLSDVNLNFEYAEYTDDEMALKFTEFVKYVNDELDKSFSDSFLVVSAFADSAVKPRISSSLLELGRNSDGIFIMAYDFHRPTSDQAGPVAPIDGTYANSDYDINTMLKDFLSKISPNKLIMGIPYYGYNWVVENEDRYAKRIEGNEERGYSESLVYDKILRDLEELNIKPLWDENAQVPFYSYTSPSTGSIRQVYYENENSLRIKYQITKNNNLAGIGIWALGYDGDRSELWNLIYDEFIK